MKLAGPWLDGGISLLDGSLFIAANDKRKKKADDYRQKNARVEAGVGQVTSAAYGLHVTRACGESGCWRPK